MFKKEYSNLLDKGRKNPKKVILAMSVLMFCGIIWLFVKISNPEKNSSRKDPVEGFMQAVDTTDLLKENTADRFYQLQEVMRLESRTKSILKKDSLTKQDSIFLIEVNEKLNNILNEKN